jgi:hypothetical protein
MLSRCALALLFLLSALFAQEHAGPSSYPAHASLPTVTIGAEYLGHGVPTQHGAYITKDYLVVRVGAFPSARQSISNSRFALRVDGQLVPAQTPALVASSLNNSDWLAQGRSTHSTDIVLGGAPLSESPPDQEQSQSRSPRAAGIGDEARPAPRPDQSAQQAVVGGALPNGPLSEPVRGLLFFHYVPKANAPVRSTLQSIELIYDAGVAGKLTIRLL